MALKILGDLISQGAGGNLVNIGQEARVSHTSAKAGSIYTLGGKFYKNIDGSTPIELTTLADLVSGDITTALGFTPENSANKGAINGYASLDGSGLVPSSQLPSYVDDVLEFANQGAFPGTGETGKIYVALDSNLTYRWGGSSYTQISSGAVASVNGQTGVVVLTKTDVGLGNVDNTTDALKPISTATQTALDLKEDKANKGVASGYASLDSNVLVPKAQIPALSYVSADVVVTGTATTTIELVHNANATFGTYNFEIYQDGIKVSAFGDVCKASTTSALNNITLEVASGYIPDGTYKVVVLK